MPARRVSVSMLVGIIAATASLTGKGIPHGRANAAEVGTLLAIGISTALSRLVAERYIKDAVPEQRGMKDDIIRAVLRATPTATSAVLASVIIRQVARRR